MDTETMLWEIRNFLESRSLTASQCQEVMDSLCTQKEVLTGDIVTADYLRSEVESLCEEVKITDKNVISRIGKRATELFDEYMTYGLDGDTEDILKEAVNTAFREVNCFKSKAESLCRENGITDENVIDRIEERAERLYFDKYITSDFSEDDEESIGETVNNVLKELLTQKKAD